MSPQCLHHILTSWAAWIEAGRPIPFNAYPPKSFITKIGKDNFHQVPKRSRPLWHGDMKSYWLADVDRALATFSDQRLCVLLGMHLPGRGTDAERAEAMGVPLSTARHARRRAREAIEAAF